MNRILSLAQRNLRRNRRRSLATLLAMAVGLGAVLVFGGYARHAMDAMQTGYVQMHGHLQIQRQGYFVNGSGNPAAYGISGYRALMEKVQADPVLAPMIAVVTPKLELGGVAGHFASGQSTQVAAVGLDAQGHARLRQWDDYDSASYSPELALLGAPPDAVILGIGVARRLQLCAPLGLSGCSAPADAPAAAAAAAPALPNDLAALAQQDAPPVMPAAAGSGGGERTRVEMLSATLQGAPNVVRLQVLRAENFGLKEFDDRFAVMHLAQAQKLVYGSGEPQVTAILVQLRHTAQMPAARARLAELLGPAGAGQPLELIDFETLAPIYGQSLQFFDSVFGFMASLIGVIVLFTVGNTMSSAVLERTTEIGTLRAIGQRRSGIRRLFLAEGLLLGALGAVLGVAAAMMAAAMINRAGLSWTPPGYVYAYPLKVHVWGAWRLLLGTGLGLLTVAALSAAWPAHRAARMRIVEALRHA